MKTTIIIFTILFYSILCSQESSDRIYIDDNFFKTFEDQPMLFVNEEGDTLLKINAYDDIAVKFVLNIDGLKNFERVAKQDLFSLKLGAESEENFLVKEYNYTHNCDCFITLRLNLDEGVCFLNINNESDCFDVSKERYRLKLINKEILSKIGLKRW